VRRRRRGYRTCRKEGRRTQVGGGRDGGRLSPAPAPAPSSSPLGTVAQAGGLVVCLRACAEP
jgi:hypothetical protein